MLNLKSHLLRRRSCQRFFYEALVQYVRMIALHALTAARNYTFLMSAFLLHLASSVPSHPSSVLLNIELYVS